MTKKHYEVVCAVIIKDNKIFCCQRGQKGCYIYCEDKSLLKYMSNMFNVEIEG